MASDDAKFNKELDLPPDFNGRIFIVDGQKLPVKAENAHTNIQVLNAIVEFSEYFRALLSSNFMKSNKKAIEIKDVSVMDFKSFLDLIRLYGFYRESVNDKVDPPFNANNNEQLYKLFEPIHESNVVSLILLADRFSTKGALNLLLNFLFKLDSFAKSVDVFDLIEVAFKIKNEHLKMLSLVLMKRKVNSTNLREIPNSNPSEFSPMYDDMGITLTGFFHFNRERFDKLAPNIRAYIREKIPFSLDEINP